MTFKTCASRQAVGVWRCPPGTKLEVRGDSKLVQLYKRGELVKVHLRQQCRKLGEAIGDFADKLLSGPTPWSKLRQAFKLLRMGEKYTSARLNAACEKALAVELIDVRRLENILVEALEEEAMPVMAAPAPPGRFARPGSVFAQGSTNGGNHRGDQNQGGENDNHQ
ncbi:hypothetical protein M1N22_03055 [Dehalococcoidia bacterium]|nr:hypothetical protein [Dehalococcoidia bacterium]